MRQPISELVLSCRHLFYVVRVCIVMALILCCIWSLIISDRVFKCTWSLFHHFMTLQGITSTDLPIRIYARADQRPRDYKSQTHAGYYLECRHPLLKCQMITKINKTHWWAVVLGGSCQGADVRTQPFRHHCYSIKYFHGLIWGYMSAPGLWLLKLELIYCTKSVNEPAVIHVKSAAKLR